MFKLFSSLLIALMFVLLPQAFAGGTPHIVLGTVRTSTGNVPTAANLTITAYITAKPDDIMKYPPSDLTKIAYYESTAQWVVEVSGFAGAWTAGEILHVDFHDADSGESNSVEVVLNNEPRQDAGDTALPVELSDFGIIWNSFGSVKIFWEAESQQQNLGWNLYRSETKSGEFVKINGKVIKGAGTTAVPMEYSFVDKDVKKGKSYFYYLEDISFNGAKHRTDSIKIVLANKAISWGAIKHLALR
ncbi:hypothetical protein FJZ31_05375 [Candidatus Poribacteria bacterium]|nr:hypothetical protein [Candidatus Poribacteria bacterium]